MKILLVAISLVVGIVTVSSLPVHAYRVQQWIAPQECVMDFGLPTQHVLTEEECDELLHPDIDTPTSPTSVGIDKWLIVPQNGYSLAVPNQDLFIPRAEVLDTTGLMTHDFYDGPEKGSIIAAIIVFILYLVGLGVLYRYYRELREESNGLLKEIDFAILRARVSSFLDRWTK